MSSLPTEITAPDPYARACNILAPIARNRSIIYGWLAVGFYPPDEELGQALDSGRMVDDIYSATSWLGQDQGYILRDLTRLAEIRPVTSGDLEADYQNLFGKSSGRVALREGAYRWRDASCIAEDGLALNRELRRHYRQFGLLPVEGLEEHLAVELEFLAFLCLQEALLWEQVASKTARELRRQERIFVDDHVGRWLPELSWRIVARYPDAFYGRLARLSDTWLGLDQGPGYYSSLAGSR